MKKLLVGLIAVSVFVWGVSVGFTKPSEKKKKSTKTAAASTTDTDANKSGTKVNLPAWARTAVEPKPLSPAVDKGLVYLASGQHDSGGWGQGGGWRTQGKGGGRVQPGQKGYAPQADVGNTAIATLALIRAGNTPTDGPFARNVRKGVDYMLTSIEASDDESLFVTEARGTQLQSKIGLYADTFMSVMVLAELKDRMGDPKDNERLQKGLDKVIAKIEKNQKEDGSYSGNRGWASVLSQSVGNKGLSRAVQAGATVDDVTIARIEKQSKASYDGDAKRFKRGAMSGSSAGISLYETSSAMSDMDESVKASAPRKRKARRLLRSRKASKKDKAEAKKELEEIEATEEARDAAANTMGEMIADKGFVAGFGSAGGEEYLSYMNISETMAAKGGDEWTKWDEQMTATLNKVQNEDGSWAGHHCITGRTFVSAAALLTLMADRAPVPIAMADEPETKAKKSAPEKKAPEKKN